LAKADAVLADVEAEQRRSLDRLAISVAETSGKRGEIALTRLRYAEAAKHFANAAAVFPRLEVARLQRSAQPMERCLVQRAAVLRDVANGHRGSAPTSPKRSALEKSSIDYRPFMTLCSTYRGADFEWPATLLAWTCERFSPPTCAVFGTPNRPEEFAKISGFSQQYISGLERGHRNPTVITLYELALLSAPAMWTWCGPERD
jgi:hypothetical protein